jgi:parallel beta-helix repeat protein
VLAGVVTLGVLFLAVTSPGSDDLPEWAREGAPDPCRWPRSGPLRPQGPGGRPGGRCPGGVRPDDETRQEIRVGPAGDYRTLREAVEAASPHAVIRVAPGTYREFPLSIDRPLTLVGEGWPVLDGEGTHSILLVDADSVHVEGFELRGAGRSYTQDHAAIKVEEHAGCRIVNNRLEDNFFGIYLARSRACEVRGQPDAPNATREADSGNGIHLWDVERVQVVDNRVGTP